MPSNTISNQMFSNTDTVIVRGHVIKDRNDLQNFRVLVIGLGQLGLPVAKYVKEKGFDTYGYDISQKAVERAEKLASIKGANSFSNFDVYIICVSTHIPEDIFISQIDGLLSIVEEISRKAKNDSLVSIESTIPKGTSRKIFEMLDHRLHVVHVPHRWYAAEEVKHGVNQLRVIGGVYDCCLKSGMQFYSGMRVVSNVNESTMRNVHHNSDGSESPRNPRLRRMLYEQRLKIIDIVTEYLNLQVERELFTKGVDIKALSSGLVSLFNGLSISKISGMSESSNKEAWKETVRAIFKGLS